MALVAFDLDNTLGYFDHIGPWGDVFSVETLENSFNMSLNPHFHLSADLRRSLKATEQRFLKSVLGRPDLLKTILRPNLDAMIEPLLKAKRLGKVRAVCIYSNTWSTYTVNFGKELIEAIYTCPGFFDCVVDSSHPIRKGDYKKVVGGESCLKTMKVLKAIFKTLCGVKGTIRPSDILFVDERKEKHVLQEQESEGLVYLKPTFFEPSVSDRIKRLVYRLGMDALEAECLLNNHEFLNSDVFHAIKFGSGDTFVPIHSAEQLIASVQAGILAAGEHGVPFKRDTREIRRVIEEFLGRF